MGNKRRRGQFSPAAAPFLDMGQRRQRQFTARAAQPRNGDVPLFKYGHQSAEPAGRLCVKAESGGQGTEADQRFAQVGHGHNGFDKVHELWYTGTRTEGRAAGTLGFTSPESSRSTRSTPGDDYFKAPGGLTQGGPLPRSGEMREAAFMTKLEG